MYTAKVLVPDTVTSAAGDALGWIQTLNVQDLWVLPRSDKEKVLGAHALTLTEAEKKMSPKDEETDAGFIALSTSSESVFLAHSCRRHSSETCLAHTTLLQQRIARLGKVSS